MCPWHWALHQISATIPASHVSNPSSMQPTTSNMSYLYTILAQETGYVLLISPGLWLPLSRVVEKARWLQLEKFKSGCRSKSSRTVQTLPMLTLWCLTLFHKLLYQLPARCNGISLLWPHQVLEHLLYLQHHLNKVCVLMDTSAMLTWFLPGNIHVHFLLACNASTNTAA